MKKILVLGSSLDMFNPIGRLELTDNAAEHLAAAFMRGIELRLECVIQQDEIIAISFAAVPPVPAIAKKQMHAEHPSQRMRET